MDNRGKNGNQRTESSLLLRPGSLMTWNSMPENSVFMPVAVESSIGNLATDGEQKFSNTMVPRNNEPLFSSAISNEKIATEPTSVTQLEQPLMVCKSAPSAQSIPTPVMPHLPPESSQMTSQAYSQAFTQYNDASTYSNEIFANQFDYIHQQNVNFAAPPQVTSVYQRPNDSPTPVYSNVSPNYTSGMTRGNFEYYAETSPYRATTPHWFYKKIIEQKELWYGFSYDDSLNIEETYQKALCENVFDDVIISVDGGRYDVYLQQREKRSVYWDENPLHVRRSTWFYKAENVQRYIPYDENIAYLIEELYHKCVTSGKWQQKLLLEGGEVIMMEGPHTILHYSHGLDTWTTVTESKSNPKLVVRGLPEGSIIQPSETSKIDHLIFVVQGIGSFCDLSFRTVYQCVDGFREIANNLIPSHFKAELDAGVIGRIEFLPLAWHSSLHTDVGFDRQMKGITLPSIPKLRYFTNDTLLDILLYSSPMYCQAIIDTVTSGLNRLYSLFLFRNPGFSGHVSVAGHSLGSLILFDILANQPSLMDDFMKQKSEEPCEISNPSLSDSQCSMETSSQDKSKIRQMSIENVLEELSLQEYQEVFLKEKIDFESLMFCQEQELKDLELPMGPRKKLLEYIKKQKTKAEPVNDGSEDSYLKKMAAEPLKSADALFIMRPSPSVYPPNIPDPALSSVMFPRLEFHPSCFFALGSPISMFLTVRGFSAINTDFYFPTCPAFFHIFHPYDPVAFRVEPLIDPKFADKPVLIPHHKGRKRMHIEIRESITKMGFELKNKLFETLKYTWNHISLLTKGEHFTTEAVEAEVNKLVQQQIANEIDETSHGYSSCVSDVFLGRLNNGRRIDYVLQEKPIEALNEYIFALTSHATYWNSEDTVLMILKEVYAVHGIMPNPCESKDNLSQDFNASCSVSTPASSAYTGTFIGNQAYSNELFSQNPPVQSTSYPLGTLSSQAAELSEVNLHSSYASSEPSIVSQNPVPLIPPPLSGFVRKSPFSKT